jgi:hypothetical protein
MPARLALVDRAWPAALIVIHQAASTSAAPERLRTGRSSDYVF